MYIHTYTHDLVIYNPLFIGSIWPQYDFDINR